MEKTYVNIRITYYNSVKSNIKPRVYYYRDDNDGKAVASFDKLTVDEANRMMWELVKLGGKNSYASNWFDNAISIRQVSFWGRL